MALPFVVYIALFLLAILLLGVKRLFSDEWKRWYTLGNAIYGDRPLPLLGNLLDIPRDSYAYTEYLIDAANRAVHRGECLFRWWVGWKLGVMVCDGEAAKAILESTTELRKGWDYEFYRQWLGDGLLLSFDNVWRKDRKLLTPIFHFQMLGGYMRVFNRQSKIMVKLLRDEICKPNVAKSELVNIFPYVMNCSLDVLCEAVMGIDIGAQHGRQQTYRAAVTRFNEFGYLMAISPHYWLPLVWRLFGYGRETDAIVRQLKALSNRVIQEKMGNISKMRDNKTFADESRLSNGTRSRKTFIGPLLEMHSAGEISLEQVREQVDTFIFAGHDTTAHAIAWTLWCLATNPDAQKLVCEEIREKLYAADDEQQHDESESDKENATEDDDFITQDSVGHLHFLDACIKEAMRIFPPVPIIERKLRNDIKIGTHLVPAGADIVISALAIHHNEKIWGADHDRFNPHRFYQQPSSADTKASDDDMTPRNGTANTQASRAHHRHPYDYIPFSAGPRNCIGQKFAHLEVRTILAHLIRNFQFTTPYAMHDNKRGMETILRPKLGVPVQIEVRCKE